MPLFNDNKSKLIVPDGYKEPLTKPIRFEDIPDDMKEKIKCAKCGCTFFMGCIEHYKIRMDGKIGYAATGISICVECKTPLPATP